MFPVDFAYAHARSLDEALDLLEEAHAAGQEAKLIAGGQSLLPMMKLRLAAPEEAWELGIEDAFADGISLIEWPERLGALLRAARKRRGLSRKQAAVAAGTTPGQLRRYERGEESVPASVCAQLAECYGDDLTAHVPLRMPVQISAGAVAVGSERRTVGFGTQDVIAGYVDIVHRLRDSEPGGPLALRSSDIFALAGALGADTTVGIQPITNFAINGVGTAYRFTPDGMTFTQPVTLTFTYTDAMTAGSAPQALEIATQDANGYWLKAASVVRDFNAKTVSTTIPHFSDWSAIEGVQLRPPSATISVTKAQNLTVATCQDDILLSDPVQKYDCAPDLTPAVSTWAVDGAPNGTTGTGVVKATGSNVGTYTAPAAVPNPKTVTVSVDTDSSQYGRLTLLSNITITNTGYAGSIDIPAGDAAGTMSAQHVEVAWTAAVPNPLAEVGGVLYYGTAGNWAATVSGNNGSCDSQAVTEDLAIANDGNPASVLEVYGGKYRFSISTKQKLVVFTCAGQPAATYIEQNIFVDGCVTDQQTLAGAPTYSDPNLLAQSGFQVATGSPANGCRPTTTASWKFTPN